ncbi:MAG: diguanylate cyclase, partial [Candidatus Omnitrophica bacterium]|nr:diguanylate cyclase [Candidatus Omnitrophota bacterium]
MLKLRAMKRVLYCVDKRTSHKLSLHLSCDVTSYVKDIGKKEYSVVIIDEYFLRRRKNLKISGHKNKTFLFYCHGHLECPYKDLREKGFFDYLIPSDTKQAVSFKIKRARRTAQLLRRINNLEDNLSRKNKKIERISIIDPLTNCYNWRYFLYRAAQELSRAHRHMYTLSFIAIDTDNFRHVNEIYGVKVADTVIKEIIEILHENLREEDVLTRWRGDEFYIILPHLDNRNAYRVAKRIHERISRHQFKYRDISLNIKTSLGVVTSPKDNVRNTRDVVGALGKCLSYAKRRGGNSIVLFSKPRFENNKITQNEDMGIGELRDKIDKMSILLTRDLLEMIYGFARAI